MNKRKKTFRYDLLNKYYSSYSMDKNEMSEMEEDFEVKFYHTFLKQFSGSLQKTNKNTIEEEMDDEMKSMLEINTKKPSTDEIRTLIIHVTRHMILDGIRLYEYDKNSLINNRHPGHMKKLITELKSDNKAMSREYRTTDKLMTKILFKRIKDSVGYALGVTSEKVRSYIVNTRGVKEVMENLIKEGNRDRMKKLFNIETK